MTIKELIQQLQDAMNNEIPWDSVIERIGPMFLPASIFVLPFAEKRIQIMGATNDLQAKAIKERIGRVKDKQAKP